MTDGDADDPPGTDGDASAPSRSAPDGDDGTDDRPVVHATRGLVDYLLDWASEAEPERLSVVIGSTAAVEFETDLDVDDATKLLTHVYLPEAGGSVNAVFGMDLGTPAGRGRARFVTHPQGPFRVTRRDDFAAVVLVAVPPWDGESIAAFDRGGRRLTLRVHDAEPPHGEFDADAAADVADAAGGGDGDGTGARTD